MALTITAIALLFFVGHGLRWFFEKTKIPDLLILVILGFTFGPILGIIDAADFGKVGAVISTTALIVILYEGGLHLSAKDLLQSSLPAFLLSILGFTLIVGAGFLVAYGIAFQPWHIALLLGLGIGSTSSAIVIPMVKPLSISDDTKTILSLESAFTDVLAIVMFLVISDSIASNTFDVQRLIVEIGPKTVIAGLMGLASGWVWAIIQKRFGNLIPEAFAGEAFALLTYGLIELAGYNGAIGVLALGFMLANLNLLPSWLKSQMSNTPVSYRELSLLSEITFLLRTFFFIYLGLLIKITSFNVVMVALIIVLLIFLTRYVAIRLLFKADKVPRMDAMVSVAMGPRGLACAVLATIPIQLNLEGGEWMRDVMFAIIPISIFLTALFVVLSENLSFRNKFGKLFGSYQEKPTTLSSSEDQTHPLPPRQSN